MFTLEQKVDLILRYIATADKGKQDELKKLVLEALNSGEAPATIDLEDIIVEAFKEIGMPQHLTGYKYVVSGVKRCVENPKYLHGRRITKGLYDDIAEEYGATVYGVERAVRRVIELTFEQGDFANISRVFGNTTSWAKGKITNGEFFTFYTNEINRKVKKLSAAR